MLLAFSAVLAASHGAVTLIDHSTLPPKEKLHIYLLIGQSNMVGQGYGNDPVLDAPDPRVIQFGSYSGFEQQWILAEHPLTQYGGFSGAMVGMGLEFAKTMLAAQADPEVKIALINHARGSTKIESWAPGVVNSKDGTKLYDNAVARAKSAMEYGVLKGILWHQGEANAKRNFAGYEGKLHTLVNNLRNEFEIPDLPFICGKLVPETVWTNDAGVVYSNIPRIYTKGYEVEAIMENLPNHRSNTFCVDNNGLRGNPDRIHFDAYSQRILGLRYANAMLGMHSDPFKQYMGGFYSPSELANPALLDPLGDNDSDGSPNFEEYIAKTNPRLSGDGIPLALYIGTNSFLGVTYRERIDTEAPRVVLQVSTNLLTWYDNETSPQTVTELLGPPTLNSNGTQTVTAHMVETMSAESSSIFCRLQFNTSTNSN